MKGIFECMSRSMKRCLKKILRQALVFYQEFFSTLIEIATLLDTRLKTAVYHDEILQP